MFGPIMQFLVGEVKVRLSPIARADMASFVENGGMQRHSVTRYLGRRVAPVLEDEYEWWEHIRTLKGSLVWGIYVEQDSDWILIGNTSLNSIDHTGHASAISGFMIFQPEWWGRHIASHCHRARTMYAFDQLNLTVIRSAVMTGNEASFTALQKVGYVKVSTKRNEGFVDGKWHHLRNMEMVNPSPLEWKRWWHVDAPTRGFKEARLRTISTLEWARENIELL